MRILHVSDFHLEPDWRKVPFKAWLNKRLIGRLKITYSVFCRTSLWTKLTPMRMANTTPKNDTQKSPQSLMTRTR